MNYTDILNIFANQPITSFIIQFLLDGIIVLFPFIIGIIIDNIFIRKENKVEIFKYVSRRIILLAIISQLIILVVMYYSAITTFMPILNVNNSSSLIESFFNLIVAIGLGMTIMYIESEKSKSPLLKEFENINIRRIKNNIELVMNRLPFILSSIIVFNFILLIFLMKFLTNIVILKALISVILVMLLINFIIVLTDVTCSVIVDFFKRIFEPINRKSKINKNNG